MGETVEQTEAPKPLPRPKHAKRRLKFRPLLRALHRDAGYFVVGLTVVYALSGLAVNHIADWDPNFQQIERIHQLGQGALPKTDAALAKHVLGQLGIQQPVVDVYRATETRLDIVLENRTLHVDTNARTVLEEGQEARFLIRAANWLHLNRGKKAWTYIADGYAILLLGLAFSGLFMIPGRKGLFGRGAIIAVLGAAVPVLYVTLSGGP